MSATALSGIAGVSYEWNDLDGAIAPLRQYIQVGEQWDAVGVLAWGYCRLAWAHRARGEVEGAAEALRKLMLLLPRLDERSWVSPGMARAEQARHCLADGDLGAALRWAGESGLSVDDAFTYSLPRLNEYLTLARVRIAQSREGAGEISVEDVLRFLAQQAEQAETHGRIWNLIEILVLQATALRVQGEVEAALAALKRALALAEPEGYVRTFIDEGQPMAELLRLAAARGISPGYVAKLLAAYGEESAAPSAIAAPTAGPMPAAQPLVEPLSERELEVVRLLAEGLTNREIAEALSVTVGTVKTHVNHIYGKLDVHSRVQAVSRARELGLLDQ